MMLSTPPLMTTQEATGREARRRDPSGTPDFAKHKQEPVLGHPMLVDNDIVYATTPSAPNVIVMPDLPTSQASTRTQWSLGAPAEAPAAPAAQSQARPTKAGSTEYVRRGQRCGDIGWGCTVVNPQETKTNGRRDGPASVTADLLKRNQFMKLSGDPCFDKHAGRFLKPMGSVKRPVL